MGKPSAPQAPDPYQSAAAQYQYGKQAAAYNAALNRINTSGPGGSVSYNVTGMDRNSGAPIYTQQTTLSPEQQQLYDIQQKQSLGLAGTTNQAIANSQNQLSNPLGFMSNVGAIQHGPDTSGIPGIAGAGDLAGFTNQARDAAYKQQTQYLDPQFSQQQEQLDARLRNSGAHPGDPAYDNAMKLFNDQKQQAYESAFNNANSQGLAEQQALYGESAGTNAQLYGQALSRMQAANAAQGQNYQQQFANQNLPLNQLSALRSGSQVAMPTGQSLGAAGQGNAAAPDLQGALQNQYQGQLNAYNAQTGGINSLLGDAGTLGAAYMMKGSDWRIKKHVRRIGRTALGLPLYAFRYLWDKDSDAEHIGVMAQHVERITPAAVVRNGDGIRLVNYALIG